MTTVSLVLLSMAGFCFLYRLLRGPSLPDRVVGLDGLLTTIVLGVLVGSTYPGRSVILATVLVVAIAGFVGTSAVARFIERRGG
jgi:multicomponent Na+:H+ antiporter subunit F